MRNALILRPALLLLLAAITGLGWYLPNRPQAADVAMPASRFNSLSFAPFRDGQSPLTGTFPSAAEVDADLALVATRAGGVRTYAAIEGDYDVAALAGAHGLKVWQGIWLGGDRAQNAREIAKGIALANRYKDVITRVVVGNEVLLRRDLTAPELAADLDQVRAAIHQPVTYADVWEFWNQFPEIANHVDIVTIHLLPYWEDDPTGITGAVAHVRDIWRDMAARFAPKPVVIGETGWPSRGRWRRDAAPSRVNQAVFLRQFIALSQHEGFDYNLIEAFDQGWKYQSEGVVGANWGIWTANRAEKFPLAGGVVEDPSWPGEAVASIGLGLLLLTCGGRRGGGFAARAVLGFALGAALAWAAGQAAPVLYDPYVRLAAVGNLAGQAALAFLLMRRAGAILAGDSLPPARDGAQATETIRAILLLRRPAAWRAVGWQDCAFDDLAFLFLWTATVLQALLVVDSRYRDTGFAAFAVPVIASLARMALGDWPVARGRAEWAAAGVLMAGAVASAIEEGALNWPFLAWSLACLVLAAPYLLAPRPGSRRPAPRRASPSLHCN